MIPAALSTIVVLAALVTPRYVNAGALAARLERAEPGLRRHGPWLVALISIAVVWFVWDAIVPIAKVHDESSYLLQADIFARFRWTAPSPPIPEFFEQPHVLVSPAVASKYPPGHALLLSLGAFVGFPPLVPLILTGLAAALLFAIVTRLVNPWVALLSWVVWISTPMVLHFQPSYLSELTTVVMVLAAWWCLLQWRSSRQPRWLYLVALAVGWGAITRPLTMLAFAIPIGVVVVRDVARLRSWRSLAIAVGVGVAVLSLLPLWSAKTTGNWKLSPIELYRRDYLPFDKLGFTPDTSAPLRGIAPPLQSTYDYYRLARQEQRLETVPRVMSERFVQLMIAVFQGSRLVLLPFAVAALFFMDGALAFALASAVVAFFAYLPYTHWAPWTIYYLEAAPVLATLAALGIWQALRRLHANERSVTVGMSAVVVALAMFAVPSVLRWRLDHRQRSQVDRSFAANLRKLPPHSIVFLRYSPRVAQHMSSVFNYPDLSAVPVWVVHDLGPRNDELRKLAPDRQSFDFEEDQLVGRNRR